MSNDYKSTENKSTVRPKTSTTQKLAEASPIQPANDDALMRAVHSPETLDSADATILQRTIGNQALGKLLQRQSDAAAPAQRFDPAASLGAIMQRVQALNVQPKLEVGAVDDPHETEADQMAEQVMQTINAPAQRQEEDELEMKRVDGIQRQEEDELEMKRADGIQRQEEDELEMKRADGIQRQEEDELEMKRAESVQRQEEDEIEMKRVDAVQRQEEDELEMMRANGIQRQEEDELEMMRLDHASALSADPMLDGGEVHNDIEAGIRGARGGGSPLSDTIRKPMENAFNADFSTVNVHSDRQSDTLNKAVSAKAFTTGRDIFFRSGEYDPGSSSGQELLAHELTHVVQQSGDTVKRTNSDILPTPTKNNRDARSSGKIQRFPDAVLTGAYDSWVADQPNVARAGEGAKGGVYFLTSAGNVPMVVVKPLMDEAPAQSQFGDAILSTGFGITTPQSRIVRKGTAEFDQLFELVKPLDVAPQDHVALMGYQPLENADYFKIMMAVGEGSLSGLSSGADTQVKVDRLVRVIRNQNAMNTVGMLAVADAVMGNDDRLSKTSVKNMINLGNYMVTGTDELVAIDTTARLNQAATVQAARQARILGVGGGHTLMQQLAERNGPQELATLFFDALRAQVEEVNGQENFDPLAHYDQQMLLYEAEARREIIIGTISALNTLKHLVYGDTVQGKQNQDALREESTRTYGATGRHDASFDSMVANYAAFEKYREKRGGFNPDSVGESETASASTLSSYLNATVDASLYEEIRRLSDVSILQTWNAPRVSDKGASSARKAVEGANTVTYQDIEKWVGKYDPLDTHILALRVQYALAEQFQKLSASTITVSEKLATTGLEGNAHRRMFDTESSKIATQVAKLIQAANEVNRRLAADDTGNRKPKYTEFIGSISEGIKGVGVAINRFMQLGR
jgi:hypothetical protein